MQFLAAIFGTFALQLASKYDANMPERELRLAHCRTQNSCSTEIYTMNKYLLSLHVSLQHLIQTKHTLNTSDMQNLYSTPVVN